jgi:hypothetical protein
MSDMDEETKAIAAANLASFVGKPVVAIVEEDGEWVVHQFSPTGVAPSSAYPSKRTAAARMLQLLHIGPVAPQSYPETAAVSLASE